VSFVPRDLMDQQLLGVLGRVSAVTDGAFPHIPSMGIRI
jgi:hypothetical protein